MSSVAKINLLDHFDGNQMLTIVCVDGKTVDITVEFANTCKTICSCYSDSKSEHMPIKDVSSDHMKIFTEYFEWQKNVKRTDNEIDNTLKLIEFNNGREDKICRELVYSASYLDSDDLMHVFGCTIAHRMKGKTPEQLRVLLDVVDDFTPEEKAAMKKEEEWYKE